MQSHAYEIILSACSLAEEEQWRLRLQSNILDPDDLNSGLPITAVSPELNLQPCCTSFGQDNSLNRSLSIQRAATVGSRGTMCQVIIRNTHNPQDLQDFRRQSPVTINRSHSHLSTHRVSVLSPKRSERSRLESSLADVWTRDKLPYPGMIASKGGQIIRASAGSLARKLSLASIHRPFSRRSSSFTLSHQKSYETLGKSPGDRSNESSTAPISGSKRVDCPGEPSSHLNQAAETFDVPEHDSLYVVISTAEPLDDGRLTLNGNDGLLKMVGKRRGQRHYKTAAEPGPESSAINFYSAIQAEGMNGDLAHRKSWSKPFSHLKNWSAEGIRSLLYSAR